MFPFDIITNLAMLIGFAAILGIGVYRREGSVRAAYCVLFCICLGAAYALKLGMADPAGSIFMPFHKLYNFSEYGSAGVLDDLFSYALPYLAAGFLFMPAFPRFRMLGAFIGGLLASLCSRIYFLLDGGGFVTDEYLFAGIGMAAGCALYILAAYIFRKKIDFKEFKLPFPKHSSFVWSLTILLIIYTGIAFTMIFGSHEQIGRAHV